MKYIESLASYVPGLIVDQLMKDDQVHRIPWRQEYETVCCFCDVSGFTALSEAMAMNGKGAEGLAKHLNSYFSQMVRLIASEGGDVFKFAGDAMIVLWPESDDIEITARRAAQCAFAIQKNLHKSEMEAGVSLSVKIGIGVGRVSVLHVGGTFNRVEYLAVGDPLIQAFASEHHSVSGEVICSKDVWKLIHLHFKADCIFDDGYVRFDLTAQNKLVPKSSKLKFLQHEFPDTDPVLEQKVKSYVAGAVLPNLNRDSPEDEQWGNEIRQCTVVFINLGLKESHMLAAAVYDEAMVQVHEVLMTTQKCIYRYEGSINKFLLDDKGSTLIACFGLPPLAHEDDPSRAVLASLFLCEKLFELGLTASIGITTGTVFCGVVGSKTRREYTVLGDSVNLSARLMQRAGAEGGGIMCDDTTKLASGGLLHFINFGEIHVKGKSIPVQVFQPYPSEILIPDVINFRGATNPFTAIHKQQLQNVIIRRNFSSLEAYFSADSYASVTQRNHQFSLDNSKQSRGRRASMTPSFASIEDSSPSAHGLIDQVRKQSGERTTFRTRKSIVRQSYDYNTGEGIDRLTLNSTVPESSPSPLKSSQQRRSSTTTRSSGSQQRRGSTLAGYKVEDAAARVRHEIHVIVPTNLRTDTLIANNIRPIDIKEVSNFIDLHTKVYELARSAGVIDDAISAQDIRLNVSGTRFFLPVSAYDMKWLPTFFLEAKSGFNDNWQEGDPIDLIALSGNSVRETQSRLALAHSVLLERKIALIESSKGSVTLIEGEVGVGKTHFIVNFISNTMFNTCPVYFSPATSYSAEAFGPFQAIIRQYLDTETSAKRDRTSALCKMLRSHEELYLDSPLLDATLGTKMREKLEAVLSKEGKEASMSAVQRLEAMSLEEISARKFRLYLYLLLYMGSKKPVVIIIDDSHHLDDDSWGLVLLLSLLMSENDQETKKVLTDIKLPTFALDSPKLMIVLAFRPLVTHRSVFRAKSLPYEALVASPSISFLKLDGLPPEEVEELLVKHLRGNVVSISQDFYNLIELKCMENPWMIKHLLQSLQTADPPILVYKPVNSLISAEEESSGNLSIERSSRHLVDRTVVASDIFSLEPMHVELDSDFVFEKCPLPLVVNKSFGTIFDRLNSCQRMILKTACHLGKQFTWSALAGSYPLDGHMHRLQKEINDLLAIGMVVQVPMGKNNERTYHFISDFLVDFIVVLMLNDQKEKISSLVQKYNTSVEADVRRRFMKKVILTVGSDGILKQGFLELHKEVNKSFWTTQVKRRIEGGDWKRRYCVISHVGLSMYRDKNHFDTSPGTATQVIHLKGATVYMEPKNIHGEDKKFVFRVDASSYLKEKNTQMQRRSFIINGENEEDLKDWLYMLKYAIEASDDMHNDEETRGLTEDLEETKVKDSRNDFPSAGRLSVTVLSTDDMTSTEVFGASNCYVCCSVDSDQHFTSVSFNSKNVHEWKETFLFPLTREQIFQSKVALSAKIKDIMMTDDILGSGSVDISGFVGVYESSEQQMWVILEERKLLKSQEVGKISISVKLDLSQDLKDLISRETLEKVREDVLMSIKEANAAKQGRSPGRISTIEDMTNLLTLVESRSEEQSSHDNETLPAKEVSLRRRLAKKLSFIKDPAQNLPQQTSTTVEHNTEMAKNLEQLLRVLKTLPPAGEMIPTEKSGSVSTVWICKELQDILSQSVGSNSILNPFEGVMKQIHELDQQDKAWLTNYQQTENPGAMTDTINEIDTSNRQKIVSRSAVRGVKNLAKTKSMRAVELFESLKVRHSLSSVIEPNIFDPNVSEAEGYFILDVHDDMKGPYEAKQLYEWLCAGLLHRQIFVRHGHNAENNMFPLAVFERPLHRIVSVNMTEWPSQGFALRSTHGRVHKISSWDFNIWHLEPYELLPLSMTIMSALSLCETFSIDCLKWKALMSRVTTYMTCHRNPYHNFYHICDVAQTCFVLLTEFDASSLLSSHEILSLMISAIVHDLDHPGLNNTYQINKATDLAIRYNDVSVLENYHCALAFEVINSTDCCIFDSLDLVTRRSVRKLMIALILATDMSLHFSLQAEIAKLASREFFIERAKDKFSSSSLVEASVPPVLTDGDRETLLKLLLHVSDISNPAKAWEVSKKWSDLVCEEFFNQGELEKSEGLAVTPNMNRDTTFQDELSLNFTDFVVAPYFFALTAILPGLSTVVSQIATNRDMWHSILMARLASNSNSESTDTDIESISKWIKRKKLFSEAVRPIIKQCDK